MRSWNRLDEEWKVRIILDTLTLKIHWDSKCSKKFIVYFQNHVPTSVHDCYIPVAVGMGRSDLGSQVADIGSRLLRMALLAFYSFIPNSISVRIRNWTSHNFGNPWKIFATYHYRKEDYVLKNKQKKKKKKFGSTILKSPKVFQLTESKHLFWFLIFKNIYLGFR